MQIGRLFEIVYILLQQGKTTAKELASRFEVSQRTVYRDIEALCEAGIPIRTDRGTGGGIALMDGFVLDRSLLSRQERSEILSALQGLRSVKEPGAERILGKLSAIFGMTERNWIEVDFSGWDTRQREKFDTLKTAVLQRKVLEFEYYSSAGEKTLRRTEPLQLWFKDRAWYLLAFCRTKQGVRMFKMNRMRNPAIGAESFDRVVPDEYGKANWNIPPSNVVTVRLKIDPTQGYRVYDEFDESMVAISDDGSFLVTVTLPDDDWVIGYILSYGCSAQVLDPPQLRDQVKERLEKTLKMYF